MFWMIEVCASHHHQSHSDAKGKPRVDEYPFMNLSPLQLLPSLPATSSPVSPSLPVEIDEQHSHEQQLPGVDLPDTPA